MKKVIVILIIFMSLIHAYEDDEIRIINGCKLVPKTSCQ